MAPKRSSTRARRAALAGDVITEHRLRQRLLEPIVGAPPAAATSPASPAPPPQIAAVIRPTISRRELIELVESGRLGPASPLIVTAGYRAVASKKAISGWTLAREKDGAASANELRAPSRRLEFDAQVAAVALFALRPTTDFAHDVYAVPNQIASIAQAKKRKAEGVKSGVPDLESPHARGGYSGLHLEVKVGAGTLKDTQASTLVRLNTLGRLALVAYGETSEAARDRIVALVDAYHALPPTTLFPGNSGGDAAELLARARNETLEAIDAVEARDARRRERLVRNGGREPRRQHRATRSPNRGAQPEPR